MAECQQDLLSCSSTHNIAQVLRKVNPFGCIEILNNTTLLNDFNHIKYHHKVDDDDSKFHKMWKYLSNNIDKACNLPDCKHLKVHYRDRSKPIKTLLSTEG
eukprot:206790_1